MHSKECKTIIEHVDALACLFLLMHVLQLYLCSLCGFLLYTCSYIFSKFPSIIFDGRSHFGIKKMKDLFYYLGNTPCKCVNFLYLFYDLFTQKNNYRTLYYTLCYMNSFTSPSVPVFPRYDKGNSVGYVFSTYI